jgi:cobalt-zinc-cadmium efflux system membrane fusion protein
MAQAATPTVNARVDYGRWLSLLFFAVAVIVALVTYPQWQPKLKAFVSRGASGEEGHDGHSGDGHSSGGGEGHDHDGHDHGSHDSIPDTEAHPQAESLELSAEAKASMGMKVGQLKLQSFERSVSLPSVVVEVRGRSRLAVVSPLTGIVTKILHLEGETVTPGEPLFEVRLTQEDLVQSQSDFLKTILETDVVQKEIDRLETVSKSGALPGKALLEKQYEKERQEGVMRAQRQALLLHGLSEQQVDDIVRTRTLLSTMVVKAPTADAMGGEREASLPLQIQRIEVEQGQAVPMGTQLAVLSDYSQLMIEGQAFEHDVDAVSQAVADSRTVAAVLENRGGKTQVVDNLKIQYVSNQIDAASRTAHVYVVLPNELIDTAKKESKFAQWRYKPGQRVVLRVPVERWEKKLVLPTEAVAVDGVETYVFLIHGKHFDRRTVKVEYRDPLWVVIAPSEQVAPGKVVAISGAQQLHLAIKNQSGGAIDPHAGHNH